MNAARRSFVAAQMSTGPGSGPGFGLRRRAVLSSDSGAMVSINQRLDAETINIVAEEFGFQT